MPRRGRNEPLPVGKLDDIVKHGATISALDEPTGNPQRMLVRERADIEILRPDGDVAAGTGEGRRTVENGAGEPVGCFPVCETRGATSSTLQPRKKLATKRVRGRL